MSFAEIIGLILALLLMLVGIAGSIVPGVPSTPLVLAAAVIHKLYFGPTGAAGWVIAILVFITVLSLAMDYLASYYGAKKLGASWRGSAGAMIGALIGIFFVPLGLLLGPFLGAMLFEMADGRNWREASKAGLGATLGFLAGAVGKVFCCVAMMLVFTANVIYRCFHS
jgi:uncharacterized protein